jgi:hypothetical protein
MVTVQRSFVKQSAALVPAFYFEVAACNFTSAFYLLITKTFDAGRC